MQIERIEMGNATIIRIAGDVDDGAVNPLRNALYDCLCEGRTQLVLNMSEVGYVSYMGLGIIVERLRRVRELRGDIKLVGVNLYLERLFRMVGVTALFEVFDTEHQAISVYQEAA